MARRHINYVQSGQRSGNICFRRTQQGEVRARPQAGRRCFESGDRTAMHTGCPPARAGMKIGLLGGSFDPPHEGHAHITRHALRRFGLDSVWWLVSPGNPLKTEGPAPLERRMEAARKLLRNSPGQSSRVAVSDVEAKLNTHYTAETLDSLMRIYPRAALVWLMGADNLTSFHKWEQWRWIMNTIPVGVLARPGDRAAALHSKAALQFRHARLKSRNSMLLPISRPPCWCFINVPMVSMSSSGIRAHGDWAR